MVVGVAAGLTLLVAGVGLAQYARHYFFLFDDFALIDIARRETLAGIASQPLIGFYRPLPFSALRGEALAFSWDAPAAYIGISLLLHAVNAALCGVLTRTFNPPRFAPMLAACLFMLSPWATEAFLWVSGRFDVMSTLGVLSALVGVRLAVTATTSATGAASGASAGLGIALAGAGALSGLFSKEQAVVLPVLAMLVAVADTDRPLRTRRTPLMRPAVLLAIGLTALPTVCYLALRANLLGALQGAYGSFATLWRGAHVLANVWSYVRACAWVPTRPAWPPQDISLAVALRDAFVAVVLPVALLSLAWRHRRLAAICVAAFLVCVAPVSWFGLSSQSTIGGRFAYLPAIWFVMAVAVGLADALDTLPRATRGKLPAPLLAVGALLLTFGYLGASLQYQVGLWQLACGLSRSTFAEIEPYRGRRDIALEIENMPHISAEGPYVLKAYAFRLYRTGDARTQPLPPILAHAALVKLAWNGQAVAPLGVDQTSDFVDSTPAGLTPQAVHLRLTP